MSDEKKGFAGIYVGVGDVGDRHRMTITARLVFGLILFVLGALWTLDNLNVLDSESILRWWPAVLLVYGLARLTAFFCRQNVVAGAVFTIAGLLMLGNELDMIHVHLGQLWPLILIAIGTSLVVRSLRGPAMAGSGAGASDLHNQVHAFAMWAGSTIKNESKDFRGGDASAVMGGVELDLRGARTTTPQVVLDVFAWWGGVEIFVPRDWRVVSEVIPLMGGYEDHSKPAEGEAATTLVIRGAVVMGGVEIKN